MNFDIFLIIFAVVCFMITAFRMRTRQGMSFLEISVRMMLIALLFMVDLISKLFNDFHAMIIQVILAFIVVIGTIIYDRYQIIAVKNQLLSLVNKLESHYFM